MARCKDFPCCGHEPGCCPDFDDSGRQLNMVCVCGAKLPLSSRYSICPSCMRDDDEDMDFDEDDGFRRGDFGRDDDCDDDDEDPRGLDADHEWDNIDRDY